MEDVFEVIEAPACELAAVFEGSGGLGLAQEDPVNQAHKVHGGGRGDMLKVCLGMAEVAGCC